MKHQPLFSVMLINDDVIGTYLTTQLLKESKLFNRPLVFSDVERALKYVQENCFNLFPAVPIPQILMIDINLLFQDGFDFVKELRKVCPDVQERTTLCFLTFDDYPPAKQLANEIGVDCYFKKPLSNAHIQQLREVATAKTMLTD